MMVFLWILFWKQKKIISSCIYTFFDFNFFKIKAPPAQIAFEF